MLQPSSSSLPPSDCSQICGEHSKIGDWISDYDDDDAKDPIFIITMMQLMMTMQVMMRVMMMS